MALAAVNVFGKVHGMVEVDIVGKEVHTLPLYGSTVGICLAELLNWRVVDYEPLVAEHARLERRDAGTRAFQDGAMAHETAYLLGGGVQAVAERKRLLGADIARIEEVAQRCASAYDDDGNYDAENDLSGANSTHRHHPFSLPDRVLK
jgi:hypothetical protein